MRPGRPPRLGVSSHDDHTQQELKMKGLKKKVAVVGVAVGAVIGGNMAYAVWTANGSGSGNAKALTAQTISVSASTGTADLYPGFTAGDVFFTVSNANPYAV